MKFLILEDNDDAAESLALLLSRSGHEPVTLRNADAAIESLTQNHYDCLLLDLFMPNFNGWEFIDYLEAHGIKTPIVIVSGYADVEPPSLRRHIPIVRKPYVFDDLLKTILFVVKENAHG